MRVFKISLILLCFLFSSFSGRTTAKEISAKSNSSETPCQDIFFTADADGDGRLSYSELSAIDPNITAEQFATCDSNADGYLDYTEFIQCCEGTGSQLRFGC